MTDGPSMFATVVFPLADALGMKMFVGLMNGEPAIAGADNARVVELAENVEVEVGNSLKAAFLSDKVSAALVKVKGHLLVYCSYWKNQDLVMLQILDANRMTSLMGDENLRQQFDKVHPKSAMEMLKPAIVASYKKHAQSAAWEMIGARSLDDGQRSEGTGDNSATA